MKPYTDAEKRLAKKLLLEHNKMCSVLDAPEWQWDYLVTTRRLAILAMARAAIKHCRAEFAKEKKHGCLQRTPNRK